MNSKIGLIGFGLIGQYLYKKSENEKSFKVDFVYEANPEKTEMLPRSLVVDTIEAMEERSVGLVVEAAHPTAVRELGTVILRRSDLLIFSLTSLADDDFRWEIENCARQSNRRIFIPHGAILGLDGIFDGRRVIDRVEITTIKHPRNMGLTSVSVTEPQVIYQGSVRGACHRFPRNVNIHAAIALAGIGFDRTVSKIVADPHTDRMAHRIVVEGIGLSWNINIESRSVGEVTGSYTPESAYQTIKRLWEDRPGLRLA